MHVETARYLDTLRRWWWLPLLAMLAAIAISYGVVRELPRIYVAQATLLVNVSSPRTTPSYNDALLSQQLVKTYMQMVVQPVVLEQAARNIGVPASGEELKRSVTALPVRDTQLFMISARSVDAATARDLANEVAAVFTRLPQVQLATDDARAVSIIQPALLPQEAAEPRLLVYVAGAAVLAVLLALALVYLLARSDDTIKTASDVERLADLPTLGVIPEVRGTFRARQSLAEQGPLQTAASFAASAANVIPYVEAYRLLRTAVCFRSASRPVRTMLVTSPGPGEGKSSVAANLAVSFALAGERVIVVDADVRKPSLHKQFKIDNERGLAQLLASDPSSPNWLGMHLRDGMIPNLRVLTSGPVSPAAAETLSARFSAILDELARQGTDLIIVDSPPVLAVADALLLAQKTEGTLIVVQANSTRLQAVRRARNALAQSGTQLLGTVINRASGGWEVSTSAYGVKDAHAS
jgi:succinoglycan biosynthesis transport protein ExoP